MSKEKKWILKDAGDAETVSRLSSELGVDPVLSELLTQRGIRTFQEARDFFPGIFLYSPSYLKCGLLYS